MLKITNIKQIDNNKFAVIIDSKKHIILGDVLLEYNVLKPCEINEETYQKIISANTYHQAYNKILKFIMAKLRTEKEIKEKLYKLNVSSSYHQKIIQKLKDENYLDDERYVKSYINDQINLTLNGPKKIIFDLKKLNFKEDLINKYLLSIGEDIWQDKIQKYIEKKLKSNHNLSKNKFTLKLKVDLNNLGYNEEKYNSYLKNVEFDDIKQMQKDYNKYYQKYSKKYPEKKIDYYLKQKLFSLGYNLDKYENLKK